VHKITDVNETDKMGEATRAMSRTTHETAHTAMDYALKAQEINTELLRRTSQAWIEGFRYQAMISQGMAQAFFGQWGNASVSTTNVERPARERSSSEVAEPSTHGTYGDTEVPAEEAWQKLEEEKAEKQRAAEAAEVTQEAIEIAAKDAQKNTETATFPIEGYDEMNVEEVSERLDGLSVDELKRVRKYEKANKGRGSLRKEMKQKIKTQGDVAEDKSTS
jgi:VCBS repeat-containing protein